MNVNFKYITLGILLIVCQILLSEYVNIWPVLYIAIFPQFIILLPPAMNRYAHMLAAFFLGMAIDLMADGVLGLNAAALTAMAYARPQLLKLIFSRVGLDNIETSPLLPRYVDIMKLVTLNALMLLIFFTVYVLLDTAGTLPLWYAALKILLCTAANCIINIICSSALFEKFLR